MLKIQRNLIILSLALGFASCNNAQTSSIKSTELPQIIEVDGTDEEMNAAIEMANQTLDEFDEALLSNDPDLSYFAIKTRFETQKGVEHIWVSSIEIKDDKYVGIVANLPESIENINIGDKIEIERDNISDWMFAENNKLRGGFTIKLLRNRMSASERKQFDNDNTIIVED